MLKLFVLILVWWCKRCRRQVARLIKASSALFAHHVRGPDMLTRLDKEFTGSQCSLCMLNCRRRCRQLHCVRERDTIRGFGLPLCAEMKAWPEKEMDGEQQRIVPWTRSCWRRCLTAVIAAKDAWRGAAHLLSFPMTLMPDRIYEDSQ